MSILTYQNLDLNITRIVNNSIYDKRYYEVILPVEISRSYLWYFIISFRNVQLSKFFTSLIPSLYDLEKRDEGLLHIYIYTYIDL